MRCCLQFLEGCAEVHLRTGVVAKVPQIGHANRNFPKPGLGASSRRERCRAILPAGAKVIIRVGWVTNKFSPFPQYFRLEEPRLALSTERESFVKQHACTLVVTALMASERTKLQLPTTPKRCSSCLPHIRSRVQCLASVWVAGNHAQGGVKQVSVRFPERVPVFL
jgi:hypothetical protein